MAKLTLSPIGSFSQSAITTINQNMDDIETALENTLSRDGTIPNSMTADLDMNTNDILNVDNLDVATLTIDGALVIPGDITSGTAADILAAIKTVDGSGSGLDADMVDGQHASEFQPIDADLTSWAAITRASGFDTFVATPSSANLKALLTDETGSGAAVFGTSPTITTPTIAGTNGAQAPLSAALNDSSSVAGNAAKFWNPLYYGNAGTAIVHRFNRVLVGEAATSSADIGPVTTKDWLETLLSSTTSVSQLSVISATGQLATTGAARTSDFRTIFGAATGGAQGTTGIGYNDDATPATTPIAAGVVGIGVHASGVNGITLNQFDINSAHTTVSATPFDGVTSGSTWALGLTAGAYGSLATQNATGAMYIGAGTTTKFNKGIISMNGALDTAVGAGGGGVTYEAYRGQSFRWLNSGNTVDAEIWGNASGLITSKSFVPSANDGAAIGTATASFSDLFLADGGVINWNNGTVTLTESATGLALNAQLAATKAGLPAYFKNTTDAASNTALRLESARATRANNDTVAQDHYIANSAGTATIATRFSSVLTNVTAGAETAAYTLSLTNAGAGISTGYNWTPANYYPTANDGAALGISGTAWSDLFLASGAVVNFAAGNATLTHGTLGRIVLSGSLGRGAPVTKTGNFSLADTENWIIANQAATTTVTLPAASSYTGREVTFKTIQAQTLVSASSNVVPLIGGAAGTAILAATAGKWATLVSDGTNWIIMQGN